MRKLALLFFALLLLPAAAVAQGAPIRAVTLMNGQTVSGTVSSTIVVDNRVAKATTHALVATKTGGSGSITFCEVDLEGRTGSGAFVFLTFELCSTGTGDDGVFVFFPDSFDQEYRATVTVLGGGSAIFTVTYFAFYSNLPALLYFNVLDGYTPVEGRQGFGVSVARPVLFNAATHSRAFEAYSTITNPVANQDLFNVTAAPTRTTVFDHVFISTTVATSVEIVAVSDAGITCTSLTPTNTFINVGGAAGAVATHTCTTDPTVIRVVRRVDLAANSSAMIDLIGFVAQLGSADGFTLRTPAAATGVVSVSLRWHENP